MKPFLARLFFWPWLNVGVRAGWCTTEWCATHDGIPMSEDELADLHEGEPQCIHIIRLWPEPGTDYL